MSKYWTDEERLKAIIEIIKESRKQLREVFSILTKDCDNEIVENALVNVLCNLLTAQTHAEGLLRNRTALNYTKESGALYINFSKDKTTKVLKSNALVIIDLADNKIVGIEILFDDKETVKELEKVVKND